MRNILYCIFTIIILSMLGLGLLGGEDSEDSDYSTQDEYFEDNTQGESDYRDEIVYGEDVDSFGDTIYVYEEETAEPTESVDEAKSEDKDMGISVYLICWLIMGFLLLFRFIIDFTLHYLDMKHQHMSEVDLYHEIDLKPIHMILYAIVGMGVPLLTIPYLKLLQYRLRHKRKICPKCGKKMKLIDEENDNKYLTKNQDHEERLKSVDYDVWLCNNCGETKIDAYEDFDSEYVECELCHVHSAVLIKNEIIKEPTIAEVGKGEFTYLCIKCERTYTITQKIPSKTDKALDELL